jgi:hypothetical protein
VATYRADSWTLHKDVAKCLDTFARKVLTSVFGEITINEN